MNWNENIHVILERIYGSLEKNDLFHDGNHRKLFYEITGCYCEKAFFTAGMIKCMYLAAWDDEHFAILLSQLMEMTFSSEGDGLTDMAENGTLMAEECTMFDNSTDATIYKLSCSFIENEPFDSTALPEDLTDHGKTVIAYGCKAADIIDKAIAM